jgi:hypothetical protein
MARLGGLHSSVPSKLLPPPAFRNVRLPSLIQADVRCDAFGEAFSLRRREAFVGELRECLPPNFEVWLTERVRPPGGAESFISVVIEEGEPDFA